MILLHVKMPRLYYDGVFGKFAVIKDSLERDRAGAGVPKTK